MKALKPSHREKKRYLLLKGKDVSAENVEKAILKYIGVLGYAEASPDMIKKNILVVNRNAVDQIRASFMMSNKDIQVTKVAGSAGSLK